ncbi:hypothetical protein FQN50_003799 [Emmonsiellopsis sp. PD_5]|nr:hypothetical protein FQN50_003799 [Emmonsiellopsis sp. PD_5]
MSPRSPYKPYDQIPPGTPGSRPRSPAPGSPRPLHYDGDESNPTEVLYRWIKGDNSPRRSRPSSSYSTPAVDHAYRVKEVNRNDNRLPIEQALVHKEFHIEALQGQVRKLVSENAAECGVLNNRIKVLQVEVAALRLRLRRAEDNLHKTDQTRAELEEEAKELRQTVAEQSHALASHEEIKKEVLAAQKSELEEYFQRIKTEDQRAATQRQEEREKKLLAELSEMHSSELDSLRTSYANELQHIQTAHAAAVHEFLARLEGKLAASEKEKEANHFVAYLGEKINRARSKSVTKEKGENHILVRCKEIINAGRRRSKSSTSTELVKSQDSSRQSSVNCTCAHRATI